MDEVKICVFNIHQWMTMNFMKDNFLGLLDFFKKKKCDVILFTEAVDSDNEIKKFSKILDMNYFYQKSEAVNLGNAILSKKELKIIEKKVVVWKPTYFSEDRSMIRLTIELREKIIVDFCCLHLDHVSESTRLKQIETFMSSDCIRKKIPTLVAGDFNSMRKEDYSSEFLEKKQQERSKWKWEPIQFKVIKHMIQKEGFIDVFKSFHPKLKDKELSTSMKVDTRIDYIFSNKKFSKTHKIKDIYIDKNCLLSDHYPVFCTVNI